MWTGMTIAVLTMAFTIACSGETPAQVAEGPSPAAESAGTAAPVHTPTPAPTATPGSTATPQPTQATRPTATPQPTRATRPTATPPPTATPVPTFDTLRQAGNYDRVTFLVSEGSEATFTVTERLGNLSLPNDAVMRTSELRGEVHLDGSPSALRIDLHRLSSDSDFRDRYVRNTMFPGNRFTTFVIEDIGAVPEEFATGEPIATTVAGLLTINGEEIPLVFQIEARDDGEVVYILGRTTFTWDQMKLPKPRARIVLSLEDEVKAEILLVARPIVAAP